MTKFKKGDVVIVTKSSNSPRNFNKVGAIGVVVNHGKDYIFPLVDFGEWGERVIDFCRISLHTETKMEIGQRYRQNSTGSEVICIGHDQGDCVVRFIDGKNRNGQERYQIRTGVVGSKQYHWTKIGVIQKIKAQVVLSSDGKELKNFPWVKTLSNVEYTFEDGKLINVTMLNN